MYKKWGNQYQVNVVLDHRKLYRYEISCEWGKKERFVTFIMLNPSQGNANQDDRTLQRCISFAKRWGYEGIKVVNLFAFVSTKPDILKNQNDPIGPENNRYILSAIENSERVVVAWGKNLTSSFAKNRIQEVLDLLHGKDVYCIKITKCGKYPMHPLYLSSELTPIPFKVTSMRKAIKVVRTVPHVIASREGVFTNGSDVGFFDDPDWR